MILYIIVITEFLAFASHIIQDSQELLNLQHLLTSATEIIDNFDKRVIYAHSHKVWLVVIFSHNISVEKTILPVFLPKKKVNESFCTCKITVNQFSNNEKKSSLKKWCYSNRTSFSFRHFLIRLPFYSLLSGAVFTK